MDMGNIGFDDHQEAGPTAAPIVPNGVTPSMPYLQGLNRYYQRHVRQYKSLKMG